MRTENYEYYEVGVPEVQLEISVFGFEMTSLFAFEIPDFGILEFGFPMLHPIHHTHSTAKEFAVPLTWPSAILPRGERALATT
jgi:hypothetical protein